MNFHRYLYKIILIFIILFPVYGQNNSNCFLNDFTPKKAVIPPFYDDTKDSSPSTTTININVADTIGRISKYIFGNAIAVWIGNVLNDPVLLKQIRDLSPTLIRYPGGSWSDIFFWDGKATDVPATIWDGSANKWISLTPQYGKNSWPTTLDNYYKMRDIVGSNGLITINYGYARYGTNENPVALAAHYAADWVRYDDGRTKFWEIGNENAGPWEAGWKIDTSINKDNQPEIITGELYGKHFKIFTDSMKAAAKEIGTEIYIGGQIIHYDGTNSWNVADRLWNDGFFKEVGDAADFYVIHNYFGTSPNARSLLDIASTELKKNIDFINQDITDKKAFKKPIALTEYNMQGNSSTYDFPKTSIINGMQAVILICELIKNNFGMSSRWLLANWESDGMFYRGNNNNIPKWNPRPDFYYIYFLQKFVGDKAIASTSSNRDLLAYASTFSSGEVGVVIVNKGLTGQTTKINLKGKGVGEKYYVYSITGGSESGDFVQNVYVNDEGPSGFTQGPLEYLNSVLASAYSIGDEIKVYSPGRSVQLILIEHGTHTSVESNSNFGISDKFVLHQNYPNPFNPETKISYQMPVAGHVILKVYDFLGREISTLVDEFKQSGNYSAEFNINTSDLNAFHLTENSTLSSGIYFYKFIVADYIETKKMILMK